MRPMDTSSVTAHLAWYVEYAEELRMEVETYRQALESIAYDPSIGNPWAKSLAREALDDRRRRTRPEQEG